MGLIRAGLNALGGTMASQWKEYFYMDALPDNVLATRAMKKVKGRFGGSRVEDDNVISEGSVIAVNEGQCMLITDNGKVVDFCAEAGEYIFDLNAEPSLFCGELSGEKVMSILKTTFERFSFGGQAGKDQRVYYFNTKEIAGNKYGTPSPVPFRIVDANIGLDVEVSIRCFGEYTYRITNPMLFYTNVCGNMESEYTRDMLEDRMKSELLTALQPAFAEISAMGIRYSQLPGRTYELAQALNEILSDRWRDLRGIEIVSFGVNSVKALEEDEAKLKELQFGAALRSPDMAAGYIVQAQGQAMKDAAKNQAGAMAGFMGMNMAGQAGGMNAANLYQQAAQQQMMQQQMAQQQAARQQQANAWKCRCGAMATGKFCPECGAPKPSAKPANAWKCSRCGAMATGKFCPECGAPKPAEEGWTCSCGAVNKGKFCSECGAKRPAGAPVYQCDKCGWKPADPTHPPKFCPECGDLFDDNDVK